MQNTYKGEASGAFFCSGTAADDGDGHHDEANDEDDCSCYEDHISRCTSRNEVLIVKSFRIDDEEDSETKQKKANQLQTIAKLIDVGSTRW